MVDRDERRAEAAKHISLMKAIFGAETKAAVETAKIYEEGEGRELEIPEPRFEATRTSVTTGSPVNALYATRGKVVVLDQGSFNRPAAGYETGSMGPEQMLCAESNLYPILTSLNREYYSKNRDYQRGCLFTDRALFLNDVQFMRNGNIKTADVVLVAAPMRSRALENNRGAEECDADLARRIETIMRVAAANEADALVLNAFACGRGGFKAKAVAELFKAWLDEHPGVFETVTFSVGRTALEPFRSLFDPPKPEAVEVETPVEEGGEDDIEENFRDIELPEGVTLR